MLASDDEKFHRLRERMVEQQIARRGIQEKRVLHAMRTVPRHLFVAENLRLSAYDDNPLPIGEDQTISQPYIVALMTELLEIEPDDTVLEIGTGCGYQAAVLAQMAKEVYSVEIKERLFIHAKETLEALGYSTVRLRQGDGSQGWPGHGPYDKIILTAAPAKIPSCLGEQLKEGGKLVAPVGSYVQELRVLTKTAIGIEERRSIPVRFVPLI